MNDMKKNISIEEMQSLELSMMKDLHDFCEKNGIQYTLGFGSCLGAMRHDGFIPWDDDIDIIMPYPDYKKFVELKKESRERYQIYCAETDKQCSITFAKYIDSYTELDEEDTVSKPIGVYIDIFPIYGVPRGKLMRKYYISKLKIYDYLISCARKKNYIGKTKLRSLAQKVIGPIAKRRGVHVYISKILDFVRKYDYAHSENVAYMPAVKWEREIFPRYMLDKRVLHKFENTELYIPDNSDMYLKIMYGNYMQLPPKEKRVSHHRYSIKFLDERAKEGGR
jgi:lipopolysaccharide cholinephosphotransferase